MSNYPNLDALFNDSKPFIPENRRKNPSERDRTEALTKSMLSDISEMMKPYLPSLPKESIPKPDGYVRRKTVVYSSPYGWPFWDFFRPQAVHTYHFHKEVSPERSRHREKPKTEEEKEEERRANERRSQLVVAGLFTAAAAGAFYLIGKDLGARQTLLDSAERLSNLTLYGEGEQVQILTSACTFFRERNREAMRRLAAKVVFTAGAMGIASGSYFALPHLKAAAVALLVAGALGWLLELGYESGRGIERDAERIYNRATRLGSSLLVS